MSKIKPIREKWRQTPEMEEAEKWAMIEGLMIIFYLPVMSVLVVGFCFLVEYLFPIIKR